MKTMRALTGFLFALLALTGCTIDIGNGSQLAGQRCFQDGDCAQRLVCNERVCVPSLSGGGSQNNANNVTLPDGGTLPDMGGPTDSGPGPGPDMLPPCMAGDRRCASISVVQICLDDGQVIEQECPGDSVCEAGACVPVGPECIDNDGDGYGRGCPRGPDCDDSNPRANPGMMESCFTSFDDNCDGQINEGCDPDGCCAGGCGDSEFCSQQCVCQPYDVTLCQYQNQPCAFEGDFNDGFFCAAFNPNNEPRCYGICQIDADDPDATCPEAGSVCAFDGDGQNGICLSPCGTNAAGESYGCGEPEMGCINIDIDQGDGICVPTNTDNELGDLCDPDYFFDCDEGLLCIQGFGNNGRCREACRPFAWNGMGTDCDRGHCLAFSAAIGVCYNDNMSSEGENCGPPQSACGEDAVGCYDFGDGNGQECLRVCRLDEGNADCVIPNQACTAFDPQQELGICF